MKDKYVCNHCGEIFYDNELTPIFSWEGEGCMRGQLFEGYKCPEYHHTKCIAHIERHKINK